MAATRYPPRRLELDELIDTLVAEHRIIKEWLSTAREAAARGDYEAVGDGLRRIEPVFRQHIADEEAQILGILIGKLGVKGAEEEIRVFRQHRPIHLLIERVGELARRSSKELESSQEELRDLFDLHTLAEEGQVFPRVKKVSNTNGDS